MTGGTRAFNCSPKMENSKCVRFISIFKFIVNADMFCLCYIMTILSKLSHLEVMYAVGQINVKGCVPSRLCNSCVYKIAVGYPWFLRY